MQNNINFPSTNSYSQSSPKTLHQHIKLSKLDLILILSLLILFFVLITFTLHNIFIVDLKSHIENEMVNIIMSNTTLIDSGLCKKLLTNYTLMKFNLNLVNYESHKSYLYYIDIACITISFILSISLICLLKFRKFSIKNFCKKISIFFSIILTITEYILILCYLSIYLKSFHMYTFIENTLLFNKCFHVEGFIDIHESIVYGVFVNTFVPETKFVYSCAAVLLMIHFGILIVLVYKIKLLIMINVGSRCMDSSFFNSSVGKGDCVEMFKSPNDSLIKYRNNLNDM